MIFGAIKIGIAAAVALTIGGLTLYARDADQAVEREKTKAALLETQIERLNGTVKRYDELRAEDQQKLAELGKREREIQRALERVRTDYDKLLVGFTSRAKRDPKGLGAELAGRLHDLLRRTGEADRDRGPDHADPGVPSKPPGQVPRPRSTASGRDHRARSRRVRGAAGGGVGGANEGARMPRGLSGGAQCACRSLSLRARRSNFGGSKRSQKITRTRRCHTATTRQEKRLLRFARSC